MGKHVTIPFNRADVMGREWQYLQQAIEGGHLSGDGPFTKRCEGLLEEVLSIRRVLLTTSCTHALEMAALLLDLGPGDEVIVPSFTFVSTANAFLSNGSTPRFIDIRPDTLNLDEQLLESSITERTRAVAVVHYGGVACEMDRITAIANKHGLAVVEDNAHGLMATYREQPLGSVGGLGAVSFHETKNFSCGEGGALLINDEQFVSRAEVIREKGTDRSRFFRGEVTKYSWVDVGSSYVMSDLLAAFLYAQLEERERIQAIRRGIWEAYRDGLSGWADRVGAQLPHVPTECGQAYHLFYVIMPSRKARDGLIRHLRDNGVLAIFHYLPLHLSEMGGRLGGRLGDCPVTEHVSDCLVRLPFFAGLGKEPQETVIEAILNFG